VHYGWKGAGVMAAGEKGAFCRARIRAARYFDPKRGAPGGGTKFFVVVLFLGVFANVRTRHDTTTVPQHEPGLHESVCTTMPVFSLQIVLWNEKQEFN
jgi:hypothetical protein